MKKTRFVVCLTSFEDKTDDEFLGQILTPFVDVLKMNKC